MVDGIELEQSSGLTSAQRDQMSFLYMPGSEDRRETIEDPYKLTLAWIDDNPIIQRWMRNESQVIWVSGKPGSGKSAFAKHLLGRISEESAPNHPPGKRVILSFFFNDRGSSLLRSERAFLQALLYQILDQVPALYSFMPKDTFDHTGNRVPHALDTLRQCLLSMLSDSRIQSAKLIIDAFDECEEDCRENILIFVTETLANHPSNPKIVITSRRYALFELFLDSYPQIRLEDLNRQDIHIYLSGKLRLLRIRRSQEFMEEIVSEIATLSKGVFLWVKLVVKELKKGKLLVGTEAELRTSLDSLPVGLNEFYDLILERLDIHVGDETMRMLEWVLFAETPLSLEDFRYAITIGRQPPPADLASVEKVATQLNMMEMRIQEYCGGFLEIYRFEYQKSGGTVQFIHQSVKDFLFQKLYPVSALPLIIAPKAQRHLAQACLRYLTLPDFNIKPENYTLGLDIPFIRHATRHWPRHAAPGDAVSEAPQMVQFCLPGTGNCFLWSYNLKIMAGSSSILDFAEKPLYLASRFGLITDVQYYLKKWPGAEQEENAQVLGKALSAAVHGSREFEQLYGGDNYIKVVQLLLDNGADVRAQGGYYGNALTTACSSGDEGIKLVQLLLGNGADVKAEGGYYGNALSAACSSGDKSNSGSNV